MAREQNAQADTRHPQRRRRSDGAAATAPQDSPAVRRALTGSGGGADAAVGLADLLLARRRDPARAHALCVPRSRSAARPRVGTLELL